MHLGTPLPIFIARGEQMKAFRSHLSKWRKSIGTNQNIILSDMQFSLPSTIQGLVVLVHGHNGMGKSTLLREYCKVAVGHRDIEVGSIINYQKVYALSSSQDQLQTDNLSNIRGFFADLAEKMASALNINSVRLQEYQLARQSLHNFREQLKKVPSLYAAERQQKRLDFPLSTHSQLHYTKDTVRQNRVDPLVYHIATFLSKDSDIPSLWRQEIEDVLPYASLHNGNSELCWEPGRLLGEALGRDLSMYANSHPVLLFFDAYENTVEEDKCLRIVMHRAGERVGWVIASRTDLWSSYDSMHQYHVASESYQEIVMPGRGLSIDLNSQRLGFFSMIAIRLYFNKLRAQQPSLPAIPSDQFECMASITQGIPLGVRIMAEIYMKDPNVLLKLSSVNSPAKVIDQLMLHYLAYPEQKEILQLCGLALLRHKNNTEALLTALGLPSDQQSNYKSIMVHLRKHADFIFDEHEAPFLHSVVRYIIRQWLLKHRYEPDKRQLFFELKDVYDQAYQKVEQTDMYGLFANPQWVEASLDLIEILFWIDVETGLRNALHFLIAASVYSYISTQKLIEIVAFFEAYISTQSLVYWQDAIMALSLVQDHQFTARQKVQKLDRIIDDFIRYSGGHDTLLSNHREEIIALLYWKVGDASLYDGKSALEWYLRAWQSLDGNQMLQHAIVQLCLREAYYAFDEGGYEQSKSLLEQAREIQYKESDIYYTLGNIYYAQGIYERAIVFYQYAILLEKGHHCHAYMNLANVHYRCKEYERAIHEYDRAQKLVPRHVSHALYYNRANAYAALGNFKLAKDDYDWAIQLDPQLAWAYGNRGYVHAILQHNTEALYDYVHAAELAPADINVVWTATWAKFSMQPLHAEENDMLLRIAQIDPHHYAAWICRAIVAGIQNKNWPVALSHIEQAIELAPEESDTHFWKGLIMAYLEKTSIAKEEIENALHLGLPLLFLSPLHWLQDDKREFFTTHIEPLLH